ncbi:MAG: hypothetical protein APF84_16680 [Gracilibacter sp. BRH_c7a]|nr:MAG: hypothetical protein APF84_16680 [Gracilibacter sp. BRH_c7a]
MNNKRNKTSNTALRLFTFFLWILLIASILWPLLILIWLFIEAVIIPDLYVPKSIKSSTSIFLVVFFWITFIGIIFFYLSKRNKTKQKTQVQLANDYTHYPWTEIISFPTEHHSNLLVKQKLLLDKELNTLSSSKLLSYGINLYNQGLIKEAIGIFRLVIDRPNSNPLLVQIAEYRLYQLFPFSGAVGQQILTKLEEG